MMQIVKHFSRNRNDDIHLRRQATLKILKQGYKKLSEAKMWYKKNSSLNFCNNSSRYKKLPKSSENETDRH